MPKSQSRFWLAAAILLVAFNLRPSLASLAPVLNEVMAETGLTASGAAFMATAPLLFLGLFAAAAPGLARRIGVEQAVLLALFCVTTGLLLRGEGHIAPLMAGSLLAGAGIGIANVLLPGLLKRDFADRAPLMTGLYTMLLCLGAAIPAGTTAPLRTWLGGSWQAALLVWAIPALLAMIAAAAVWRGRLREPYRPVTVGVTTPIWRSRLAWQVTFYMGLQSMLAYTVMGWMAPILRARGDSAVTAGLVVSVSILSQVVASLPSPILAARLRSQSWPAAFAMLSTIGGFTGLLYAPLSLQFGFAILMGLGMGGSFALAVLFMVLRSPNAALSASLSGMSQSIGYSFAATGPLLVGIAHDATNDWSAAMAVFALAGTIGASAGWLAGRDRMIAVAPQK